MDNETPEVIVKRSAGRNYGDLFRCYSDGYPNDDGGNGPWTTEDSARGVLANIVGTERATSAPVVPYR